MSRPSGRLALATLLVVLPSAAASAQDVAPGYLLQPTGLQWSHDAVYNPALDEYFITAPSETTALGVRVDPCGSVIDQVTFFDDPSPNMVTQVAVAYNPDRNEYLAVIRLGEPQNVFGRYLDATGHPIGATFPIVADPIKGDSPTVVYSSTHQRYLVRWDFAFVRTTFAMVDGNSAAASPLLTGHTLLHEGGFSARSAYSPASDRYLFVYATDSSPSPEKADIWARFVSGDGLTVDAPLPIAVGFENQQIPFVSYSLVSDSYLVTWEEWKDAGAGQSANVGAALLNADGQVVSTFAAAATGAGGWDSPGPLAYNSVTDSFLVVWFLWPATHVREIDALTGALGADLTIADTGSEDVAFGPRAAVARPHPTNPQFLVTYSRGFSGLYAGILNLDGSCTDTLPGDDVGVADAGDAGSFGRDAGSDASEGRDMDVSRPDVRGVDAGVADYGRWNDLGVVGFLDATADAGPGEGNAVGPTDARLEGSCACGLSTPASPSLLLWALLTVALRRRAGGGPADHRPV